MSVKINMILLLPQDASGNKQSYKVSWCWGILCLLEQQIWLKAGLQYLGDEGWLGTAAMGPLSSCLSQGTGDVWRLCQAFDTLTFLGSPPG